MTSPTSSVPNPGSPEAAQAGCTCPVIDNHHGAGVPTSHGPLFWMTADCPIHGYHEHETISLPSKQAGFGE